MRLASTRQPAHFADDTYAFGLTIENIETRYDMVEARPKVAQFIQWCKKPRMEEIPSDEEMEDYIQANFNCKMAKS